MLRAGVIRSATTLLARASTPSTRARTFRATVIRGVAWSASTTVVVQICRLGFGLVLARLLTPHDYGLAAMALVFGSLVMTLSDFALGSGLIQRSRITEADRSTVFWLSAAMGLLLTGAAMAVSGPLAAFFGEPAVQPLFIVVSLGFITTALGRVPAALFQRAMNFRFMSVREITAVLLGSAVGLALAVAGYGPWALVAQGLTMAVVSTTLLWIYCRWRPRLVFSARSLRDLGAFGIKVSGTRVVDYLTHYSDKLLIGRFLGASSLGAYSVAATVVFFPVSFLLIAISDTVFAAVSRIQDEKERVARAWLRGTRVIVAGVAPAMLGLLVVAPDFVAVALGEKWKSVTDVLQLMTITAIVFSASALGLPVLNALGRAGVAFRFALFEFAFVVTAVALGVRGGILGVAAAYLVGITLTRALLVLLTRRAVGATWSGYFGALAGVTQAALVMTLVVWATRSAMVDAGIPAGARVGIAIVLGIAVYVPLLLWRSSETRTEALDLLRRRSAPGSVRESRGQPVEI
jgi:O-antigen/teichoic acid export membrane protein